MENLSRIAQGIFLGNGEVWNFLDYAVNRNCGGLLHKTQQLGLLDSNFTNNFNGGLKRKYNYEGEDTDNIPTFNAYSINSETGKIFSTDLARNTVNSLYPIHGRGGNLGDLYTVPEFSSNSALKFITKENFKALGKQIRDDQTSYNGLARYMNSNGEDEEYKRFSLESYAGKVSDEYKPTNLSSKGLGDDVDIQYIENSGSTKKYTLLDLGRKIREKWEPKERTLLTKNFEGSLNPEGYKVTVNTEKYGEVLIDAKKYVLSKYISENNGLSAYYGEERDKYVSTNINEYPGVYGIVSPNEQIKFYNINEENDFQGEVSISPDFKGGMHSSYNVSEGTRSYSFYQEAEKGAVPTELETSVSDGSSVLLDSYSGASRLLRKTNQLFKEAKINSLINRFHTDAKDINSELITAADSNFGLSRGRNLLKKKYEGKQVGDTTTGYDNPYCRVWTAHHQYSKLKDRIRPFVSDDGKPLSLSETQSNYGLLRPEEGLTRLNNYSVLSADGFVKITPTHDNGKLVQEADKLKNYMFSIENLAWRDVTKNENSKALSKEQRGPNGGRIMWFPPYNLKFSENVNVNWNANSFIGRGEEIYTYTNTVRSGTLDFTLLIDHPSILNKWRGTSKDVVEKEEREKDLLRFFAGCGNLNDEVEAQKPVKETETPTVGEVPLTTPEPTFYSKDIAYVIFFPNDFSAKDYVNNGNLDDAIKILKDYNSGASYSVRDESYKHEILQSHNLESKGFNPSSGYTENIKKQLLGEYDDDIEIKFFDDLEAISSNFSGSTIFGHPSVNCEIKNVTVKGFASSHGYESNNRDLCNRRRTFIQKLIEYKCQELSEANVEYVKLEGSTISVPDIDGREDVNSLNAKIARAAYAVVSVSWKEENIAYNAPSEGTSFSVNGQNLSTEYKSKKTAETIATASSVTYTEEDYTYDNEYLYFANVRGNEMIYKNILDKVRYFDPAFHSVTPEGFNARLTFLHQCTRQGPTNAVTSGRVKGKKTDESGNTLTNGSPDYLKFAGNLSFGRAPYCILRIGDFFNTKICIDSMSINYDNNGGVQWDLNPEGVGVQPMYANISISFKFLGGQDITRPIERLQNAVTANYYANASVYNRHADNNKFYFDALEDNTNLTD